MSWFLVFRILLGLKFGYKFITQGTLGNRVDDLINWAIFMLICSLISWWGLTPILDLI